MTAQMSDTVLYRGQEYSLAGISEGEVFDISVLGLKPVGACTACWRGYQAVFAIVESQLVLHTLHVNLGRRDDGQAGDKSTAGPVINGTAPSPDKMKRAFFNNHYEGLNYALEYSGGLLLADGFIRHLYVHMGFHPAWKYKQVIELIFAGGRLIEELDRSARMAEIRQMAIEARTNEPSKAVPSDAEIEAFVERAFDRRYRM